MIARSTFSNGIVLCCRSDDDDSLSAVKCIDVDNCPTSALNLLQHEIALMRTINHPNINVYSSVWLSKSRLCMSSPFMEFGSCADIISSQFNHGMPENVIVLVLFEILKALSYLHGMNLIHRGIRCSHILVSTDGAIKLSGHRNMIELTRDGVPVRKVYEFPKHDSSMLPWLSPEILQQDMQGYCTKSDIYSLGITACELANGHAPFTDMSSTQMLLEKLNGTIPFMLDETTVSPLMDNEDPSTNDDLMRKNMIEVAKSRRFSGALHELVTGCLERDPDVRMDANHMLRKPIFKELKNYSNLQILQPVLERLNPISKNICARGFQEQEDLFDQLSQMTVNDVDWDFQIS